MKHQLHRDSETGKFTKQCPVKCNQCAMLSINGIACHERGCPNMGARWDCENQTWVRQRECFECGCTVDADDSCCNGIDDYNETEENENEN